MSRHKKETLKTTYYRSFLILIVVPILVITMSSIVIIRKMMKDAGIQNIKRAQDHIVSTLDTEVRDISLRLSHFAYVNDNEIMKLAAKTDTDVAEDRYHYTGLLTESFNYAMVPVQDILATIFLMKSGRDTYLKDGTVLSKKDMENTSWYQAALAEKNVVQIGFYDTNVTTSRRSMRSFTLTAALSPGIDVDRDEKIEMVTLFMSSRAGNIIQGYNKDRMLGKTIILDKRGKIIYDPGDNSGLLPKQYCIEEGGGLKRIKLPDNMVFQDRVDGKNYVYVTSIEPGTACQIISIIKSSTLTRDFNRAAVAVVGVTLILFGMFYFFTHFFLRNIVEPVHEVVDGMAQLEAGNLEIRLEPTGQAEIRTMVNSFNHMAGRIGSLMDENKEQQQKKHEAEIRALQSQINPHFLVNSLNSIRFMAQVAKFDGIRKMAEALIKILSTSFRSSTGFYSVKEELEVLDGYIYLMKIRYSDGFDVEYHVEESCLECQVPRLILQPIVENSIVHGFSSLEEMGRLELTIIQRNDKLCISVWDNGKGMTEQEILRVTEGCGVEKDDHTSIGVHNVFSRLKLNYGDACLLTMESEPGVFTKTSLELPIVKKKENEGHTL